MSTVPVVVTARGFGQTARRDAWWATPAVVFTILSAFVVYATWAAFQNQHYTFGPYLSPFYSPEIFGDSPHAWFGPQAGLVAGVAAVLAGADHPAVPGLLPLHLLLLPRRVLQGVLGRPAVVRRRRAAHVYLGRALVPADPAERPPLLPLRRADLPASAAARRLEGVLVRRSGHGRGEFGVGVGTILLAVNVDAAARLHARLPLAAAPGRRPARRDLESQLARTSYCVRRLPEPQAHASGRGAACSRWPSRTSTSGSARWACGPT